MDLDAFVRAHDAEWRRLERLSRRAHRPARLSGDEADELVRLYQRTATHLAVVQSRLPDPALAARLSRLVVEARVAVAGAPTPAWRDVVRFVAVTFPAAVYRSGRWWVATAVASVLVMVAFGVWVATHPEVQGALLPPEEVRQLVQHDFRHYYSSHPGTDFAAQVWTNNALVAAGSLALGVLAGLPTLFVLLSNAANVGVSGGFMAAAGKSSVFFGLILPHGMLELTAVFIAAGVGLRLGWTWVDPGPRRRADALAAEGRAAMSVALGLVGVLAVSGAIEAFVTPSSLPTWARLAIGALAEAGFLAYVVLLGRRAVAAGEAGDVPADERADAVPAVG